MFEWKASFDPKMLGDVLAMRMGRWVAGTVRAFTPDPRVAQMIDHFTQYVGSSPYGSPADALRHRAHADRRRRLVSDGRHARRARGAGETRDANSASNSAPASKIEKILRARRRSHRRAAPTRGEEIALRAVVSNCDSVRTHRELINGAVGASVRAAPQIRARLLRRRALPRLEQALRTSRASRFRLQPRSARGVRLDLQKGRARARPDLLSRGDDLHRTRHRARRRRSALRARPHAVSAAASRLEENAARVSPRHPGETQAHRPNAGHRVAHRLRARAHAAGHPRSLSRS